MRTTLLACLVLAGCVLAAPVAAQDSPFAGRWDITVTTPREHYPLWLEVKVENGQVTGMFQDRTGSVHKLPEIAVEGKDLVFSPGAEKPEAPKPMFRAHVQAGKLVGEYAKGPEKATFVGVRPPAWKPASANGAHKFGKPVDLFNGKDLTGWKFQFPGVPGGWAVENGLLTNQKTDNNIVSTQQFRDFKVVMEYRLEKDSNSGLYLRGRYELQVLDDAGKPPFKGGHMAVYGRVVPTANASKPAGEWQTTEVTLVGNHVTVVLNGQTVQNDVVIDGITGGALDSNEAAPGPIMIQGDHSHIWIRKLVVTPILTSISGN